MDSLVGIKIYGYCEGYFDRDDYNDKVIILEGKNGLFIHILIMTV